jgi:hypothetical protein
MIRLLECSDDAFLKLIRGAVCYYDEEAWDMLFGDATDEEIVQDRMYAMHCTIGYMESMYDMDVEAVV